MTKFITLVSGKGGTGKTTTAINLAAALKSIGKETILIDANLETPNVSLYLGMPHAQPTLNDFFKKKMDVDKIITTHASGIRFIPASLLYSEIDRLNTDNLAKLFAELEGKADYVIIDGGAGLGKNVVSALRHDGEVLIITNPNRAAITDSLKIAKRTLDGDATAAGIVLNRVHDDKSELSLKEIRQIISHPIATIIPEDDNIRKAHHQGTPVIYKYPKSKASKAYMELACFVSGTQMPKEKGWLEWLK